MITGSRPQPITVLLDKQAHHYAQLFASEQLNPEKGKQVYLNTLAVYAVHCYCQWLSIPHSLQQGDCWQPQLRAIFNVADLVLPQIGKLECRPLFPDDQGFFIPPEASSDRLGYIAVQFRETLDQVELLGFINSTDIGDVLQAIPLTQLQPLDHLMDTLDRHQISVNLRQWFQDNFSPEWQPPSLILALAGPTLRSAPVAQSEFEPSISRAKVIHWEKTELNLILGVKIREQSAQEVDICLQIYPNQQLLHLPSQLQVTVFDQAGTAALQAKTGDADNWIQLEFTCHPPEKFSLTLTLGENTMTELFNI
ncbi:DUF1822 family protein [Gloeothece verrucosa]|uniref:DUF1822 domain-containing protein n=1 Tax=Gloeothece verrucosa (strain PCC 7822) TaxID=497965 RepID=E0U935_GLOV7|nr:DUF1822 family protein [Gloeothece verrucosa]ADN16174.1 Protein of unknown function DUF1822 [Gloeothece verrucosa PCC 7822]